MLLHPRLHQGIELRRDHVAPVPRGALPEEAPDGGVGRGAEGEGGEGVAGLHLGEAGVLGDPVGGGVGGVRRGGRKKGA